MFLQKLNAMQCVLSIIQFSEVDLLSVYVLYMISSSNYGLKWLNTERTGKSDKIKPTVKKGITFDGLGQDIIRSKIH